MMHSLKLKENYLKRDIPVKVAFLLWMAVLAYIFSALLEKILLLYGVNVNIFLPLGIKKFLISTNWYVYELIGFYILFFISMRFIKEKYQLMVIGFVSIIAFCILYYSGLVEAYYNSIIGFWFGIFVSRCGGYMERYRKGYLFGGIVLIFSFAGMFLLDHQSIGFAVIRNLAAVGAIVIVLYVVRYLNINNMLLRYISRISPEIYFYHMPIALLCSYVLKNTIVYAIVVIVMSLLVAVFMNPVNHKVQRLIKGE